MGLADVAQMAAVLREVWIDHGASMDGFSNGLSIMLLLVVAHLYMRHVFCFLHMAAFLVDVAAFSDMSGQLSPKLPLQRFLPAGVAQERRHYSVVCDDDVEIRAAPTYSDEACRE